MQAESGSISTASCASRVRKTSGEKAEVDFLIESAGQIFPLEVKAGKSVAGKSLSVYARKFDPSLTIRLSGLNLKKDNRLLNVPLALVDWLLKFIEMAL